MPGTLFCGAVTVCSIAALPVAVSFTPLLDRELYRLADDQLIAYVREAGAAGDVDAGRRALAFLVYGYERDVRRRLTLRVPRHAVDDVAQDALVRAIASAFDGSSEGEFRSWLHTIVDRTAADWFRRSKRRPAEAPLPSEHQGEEDVWGDEPFIESAAGAVELRIVVDEVIATLSDKHRAVVDLHVFNSLPAAQVCERVDGVSEGNVAQIASRFRARVRARLTDPGGGG